MTRVIEVKYIKENDIFLNEKWCVNMSDEFYKLDSKYNKRYCTDYYTLQN